MVTHERLHGYVRRVEPADYNALQQGDPVVSQNLGGNDRTTARIALLWQPDSELKIEPSVFINRAVADGLSYADSNRPRYSFTGDIDPRFTDRLIIGNLTMTRSFPFGDLVSSSSYLDRRTRAVDDYSPVARRCGDAILAPDVELRTRHAKKRPCRRTSPLMPLPPAGSSGFLRWLSRSRHEG